MERPEDITIEVVTRAGKEDVTAQMRALTIEERWRWEKLAGTEERMLARIEQHVTLEVSSHTSPRHGDRIYINRPDHPRLVALVVQTEFVSNINLRDETEDETYQRCTARGIADQAPNRR
jgi:hypothetical protein